jgi:hypothetical protein
LASTHGSISGEVIYVAYFKTVGITFMI